jgi:hypothetical protein
MIARTCQPAWRRQVGCRSLRNSVVGVDVGLAGEQRLCSQGSGALVDLVDVMPVNQAVPLHNDGLFPRRGELPGPSYRRLVAGEIARLDLVASGAGEAVAPGPAAGRPRVSHGSTIRQGAPPTQIAPGPPTVALAQTMAWTRSALWAHRPPGCSRSSGSPSLAVAVVSTIAPSGREARARQLRSSTLTKSTSTLAKATKSLNPIIRNIGRSRSALGRQHGGELGRAAEHQRSGVTILAALVSSSRWRPVCSRCVRIHRVVGW